MSILNKFTTQFCASNMENFLDGELVIPTTYNGILEFINENRGLIARDFKLIFRIFDILDNLLKSTNTMADLHKDTRIVLETIKLQLDSFLKEYRNEMSLSKMLIMAENDELDDFFLYIQSNSQAITFVDRLDFEYTVKEPVTKSACKQYDAQEGDVSVPVAAQAVEDHKESIYDIQRIKSRVVSECEVEFFNLIFDANSYSQTVKNAFNLALALRMKQVSLVVQNSVLVAVPFEASSLEQNHSVFEITPMQHERLKAKLPKSQHTERR